MASAVASGEAVAAPSSSTAGQGDASSQIATTSAVTLDHPMATTSASSGLPPPMISSFSVKEEDEDAKLFTSLVNGIQNGALAAAAASSGSASMGLGGDGVNGMNVGPGIFDGTSQWQPPMQGAMSFASAMPMGSGFGMNNEHMQQQPPFPMGELEALGPIQAYAKLEFPGFSYYIQTLDFTIGRRPAHYREQFSDQQHITGASKADGDVDVDLGPLKSISRFHVRIFYQDQPAQQAWSPREERANSPHNVGSQSSRSASAIEDERGGQNTSQGRRGSSPKAHYTSGPQAQGRFVLQVLGRNGACVDDVYVGKDAIVPLGRRTKIQIAERVFYFVLPPPSTQIEALQPRVDEDATHDDQLALGHTRIASEAGQVKAAPEDDGSGSLGTSDEDEEESEESKAQVQVSTGDTGSAEQQEDSGSGEEETSDEGDSDEEEDDEKAEGNTGPTMPSDPSLPPHITAAPNVNMSHPIATAANLGAGPIAVSPGAAAAGQSLTAASTSPAAKKRKRGEAASPEPPKPEAPMVTTPAPAPIAAPIPTTPVETPTANKRKRAKKPTPGPMPGSGPMGAYPGMPPPMNPMGMFGSLHGGIVGPATAALLQQFSNTPAAAAALMAATGGNMNMSGQSPYSMPPHMMSPYPMGPPGGYGGGPPGIPMPGQMGSPMPAPGSPFYGNNAALGRGSPARMDKPDKSNVDLIREAMSSPLAMSRGGKMTLQEVYDYLAGTYEYYRNTTRLNGPDWHNSIRHSIQSSKSIVRIPRKKGEPASKGTYYAFTGSEAAKQHAAGGRGASSPDSIKAEEMSPSLRPGSVQPSNPGSATGSPAPPGSPANMAQRLPPALGQSAMAPRPPGASPGPGMYPGGSAMQGPPSAGPGALGVRPGMPYMGRPMHPSASPSPTPQSGNAMSPVPPGRVQIIIGRAPPAALAQSAAAVKTPITQKVETVLGGAPIIPFEGTLFLSPQIFGRMSAKDVNDVGAKGAVQAVKALQGHMIAHLQAKMGAGPAAEGASATAASVTAQLLQPPGITAPVRPPGGARPPPATSKAPTAGAMSSTARPGSQPASGARPPVSRPPNAAGAKQTGPALAGRPTGPAFSVPANGRPASVRPPSATIARPGQAVRPITNGLPSSRPPGLGMAANGAAPVRPGAPLGGQPRPTGPASSGAPHSVPGRPPGSAVRPPATSTAGRPGPARPPAAGPTSAVNGVARPTAPQPGGTSASAPIAKAATPVSGPKADSPSTPGTSGSPAPASDIAQLLALIGGGKIDAGKLTAAQRELLQVAGRLAAEQQKAQQAKLAAAAAGAKASPAPPLASSSAASSATSTSTPQPSETKVNGDDQGAEAGQEQPSTPPPPSPPKTRAQAAAQSSPSKAGVTRSSQAAVPATPPKTRSAASAATKDAK